MATGPPDSEHRPESHGPGTKSMITASVPNQDLYYGQSHNHQNIWSKPWPSPARTPSVVRDTHSPPPGLTPWSNPRPSGWSQSTTMIKHSALPYHAQAEVRNAGRPLHITQSPGLHFHICTRNWTRCSEVLANLQIRYNVSVIPKTNLCFSW